MSTQTTDAIAVADATASAEDTASAPQDRQSTTKGRQLAVDQLLEQQDLSPEAIERFLETHTFPILEGTSITFAYHGSADGVLLQHFIYGLETSQPFERVAGTNLWYLVLDLPKESNLQYKINVLNGKDHHWILDPLNPQRALDPFGANSVVRSHGTQRPSWTFPDPEVRPGKIVEELITSEAFGEQRSVSVYLPARFRPSRRYPLLIVHDGRDYMRFSSLKTVFDNVIHRLETAPMIVALTNAKERLDEYPDHRPHSSLL